MIYLGFDVVRLRRQWFGHVFLATEAQQSQRECTRYLRTSFFPYLSREYIIAPGAEFLLARGEQRV